MAFMPFIKGILKARNHHDCLLNICFAFRRFHNHFFGIESSLILHGVNVIPQIFWTHFFCDWYQESLSKCLIQWGNIVF